MAHGADAPHAARYARGQCEALFAAVLVNDVVDPAAALPATPYVPPEPEDLAACYGLSLQLWRDAGERVTLIGIGRSLCRHGALEPEAQVAFKHIRAKYKQLRASCGTCSETHVYPPVFQLVVAVMGSLQDAFKNRRRLATRTYAFCLLGLLGAPVHRCVLRELDAFTPTTAGSFARYVDGEMARARATLARRTLTAHEFHALRKIVSRQTALYCALNVLRPTATHGALFRYLGSVNGMMGQFHDILVERRLRGSGRGKAAAVVVPREIRARLDALLAWFGA